MLSGVFRRFAPIAMIVPAVLMAGCQSDLATGPRIVSVVAKDGLGQSGTVGALLAQPLVVRAQDQSGDPVSGVLIEWSVTSGGGVVTPSQTTTGSDGEAQAELRLGSTLGQQSVTATLQGAQPVTFTATASAAPVSQLAISSGDNQTATVLSTLSSPVAVVVTDAFNNPKTGVVVIFTVVQGGGTLTSATATSNASGIASVGWTMGSTAGAQRVAATIAGIAPVVFNATASAGAPAKVLILGGTGQSAPPGALLADSLVIKVTDQFDNAIPDVTVNWVALGLAGTVSPTSGKTDETGRAATSWTLGGTGGPKTVQAIAAGLPAVNFTAAGTIIFAQIEAGARHSCGLDEGGVAYCWGFNGDGQLGIGELAGGSGPVFATPQPTAVAGNLTFRSASGGGFHTCMVTLSADPYCWGRNVDGRLGNGTTTTADEPQHTSGVNVYSAMSAGGNHSCALTPGGRVWCWGSNAEGQVGVVLGGVITSDSLSFSDAMPLMPGVIFTSVAAGGLHSCAVTSTGAAWCWGHNADGQIGDSTFALRTFPVLVKGGLLSFTSVTVGGKHSCALDTSGAAHCWGDNTFGQLGDGTTVDAFAPVPVAGGLTFASLNAGENHTCGITPGGVAYCWGQNTSGQLGNGTTTSSSSPVAVGGGLSFGSISAGALHSCGVTPGRVAYCWGGNQFGQLGDETQSGGSLPSKVTFQP
jgi:alpha-tubulin suppressor-like RCC1 family protein